MKKLISLTLAVLMLALCISATGCGAKGKTLAQVKSAGELVIATSPDFPPFESLADDAKTVEGIEIDLLNMICADLGVKLKIEQMDFDSVLAGVQAGKYDVGVSGITANEERKKEMLFTNPYCLAAQAIVVTSGSSISAKADLTGKKIAVQTATTAEAYCNEMKYGTQSFQSNPDAESALVSGKVDAWVIDDLTAAEMVAAYNAEHGDGALVILPEVMTTEPYAFAFAFGSDDLVAEINKSIDKYLADGTIASIFAKYDAPFTSPSSVK